MRSSRPPKVPPVPGQNLDIGPYRLANRIAVGGMAEVFRALDDPPAGEPRSVVIKRMLPDLAEDPECRRMFQLEADLGLRIDHANVVRVLDHGVDERAPYIVLEYVFGVDLWRLTRMLGRTGTPLRPPVAMYVVTEMLAGLAAVHSAVGRDGTPLHIEHRDVSPSNIFLSVHGDVKLGDLGIAVAGMRESHPSAPRNERGRGKLGYLAPEIVRGVPSDQRADIFSAGVVAAELLLGRPLFTGAGEIGILLAIRDADIRPFHELAGSLPKPMATTIMRALAREPEHRLARAAEVRDALLPFVDEPVKKLRVELGRLVATVLSETVPEQPGDRGALAQTVEHRIPSPASSLPAILDDEGRLHVQSDTGELVPVNDTASLDDDIYEVTTPAGSDAGAYRLAELVRTIAMRAVGPEDRVSLNGDEPRPLRTFPKLARHLPPSSRTPTLQKRIQRMQTTELHNLAHAGMLVPLGRALLTGGTGLLLVEQGDTRVEIYLAGGAPVYVSSNRPEDLLGARLVARGVITQGELDMALAVMPRFDGRLGETLSALGLVEPVQLVRHIGVQVRERLLDTFTWTEGRSALYGGVEDPGDLVKVELDPWSILENGAGLRIELGLEMERFAGRDSSSRVRSTTVATQVLALRPPVEVAAILGTAKKSAPIARIDSLLATPGEGPSRGRRLALVLFAMGALTWADP